MRAASRILLALAALAAPAPGRGEVLTLDQARALARRGEILCLAEALSRIRPQIDGEIIAAELEAEGGRFLYRIKALGPDGRYRETRVDARADATAQP